MLPLFEDPDNVEWEGPAWALTAVCSQQHLVINQADPASMQHYSMRDKRFRCIRYRNGEEELYDHNYDPYEWFNLAGDPSLDPVKQSLKRQLLSLIKKVTYSTKGSSSSKSSSVPR